MATYLIRHSPRLSGEVEVSCAKNAVLPILAAGLLSEDPLIIKEVPRITDVEMLLQILRDCGAEVHRSGMDVSVCALQPQSPAHEESMRRLRASILILGPILARTGSACVGLPGGCAGPGPDFSVSFFWKPLWRKWKRNIAAPAPLKMRGSNEGKGSGAGKHSVATGKCILFK